MHTPQKHYHQRQPSVQPYRHSHNCSFNLHSSMFTLNKNLNSPTAGPFGLRHCSYVIICLIIISHNILYRFAFSGENTPFGKKGNTHKQITHTTWQEASKSTLPLPGLHTAPSPLGSREHERVVHSARQRDDGKELHLWEHRRNKGVGGWGHFGLQLWTTNWLPKMDYIN